MSPNNYNKVPKKFETEILNLAPYFAYTNLAISSLGTFYRAYANNDVPMIAFVAFILVAYFVLEICFRALAQLPNNQAQDDDNHDVSRPNNKRLSLKIVIWLLSSSILFGFAYQLGTFTSLPVTALVFGAVSACSACIFFVYFVHDDTKGRNSNSNNSDDHEKMIMINEDNKRVEAVFDKV